jgi:stage II sporulation protein D
MLRAEIKRKAKSAKRKVKVQSLKFLVLSFSFALFVLHFTLTCYAQPPKYIRVAIIQNAESLSLKVSGFYEIADSSGKKVLSRGKNLKTTVTTYKNGILMGKSNFDSDRVLLSTDYADVIIINGRTFRGNIKFIKNNSSKLSVINYVDPEDYIRGILYHEVSHYWPMEVLKAQAIVCRTYAVYQMQENRLKDYDVTSDIYSQVYGGKTSERYRTSNAVDATRTAVLTYQGKVFPAYFHSTCGGHTEDAFLLWNTNIVPLKGVPCDFCKDSPHFNWHYVLTLEEVQDKLIKGGFDIGSIKDITIMGRDESGRITDLKVVSTKKSTKIPAKDFRNIIGLNIIRSTNFTVNLINADVVFEGRGWGHGVGLCQWGAYFMAKQDYTAEQILKYYYPQANVETIGF